MRQGSPKHSPPTEIASSLLQSALEASEIAVWQLCAKTRRLFLFEPITQLIPELGALAEEAQLLALMRPEDRRLFQYRFPPFDSKTGQQHIDEQSVHSCQVTLTGLASQPGLRFVARLERETSGEAYYLGVVTRADHWLADPGTPSPTSAPSPPPATPSTGSSIRVRIWCKSSFPNCFPTAPLPAW